MRKVELTMNEQEKYEVIKKLVETNGNKDRATVKLQCSRRTIDRMINKYNEFGKQGFSHGNHNHKPVSTISKSIKNCIITLYENNYFCVNLRHFTELLEKKDDIVVSEDSVRNIIFNANILSPKAHKLTKKALKRRLE